MVRKLPVSDPTKQNVSFKGALLQNSDVGYGYFLGTNQSGSVYFGE